MLLDPSFIEVATPSGMMGVDVYTPNDGSTISRPSLILYSEIFQNTGPIKRLAMQFASHGYVVFIPEIFHEYFPLKEVLDYDDKGRDDGNRCKLVKPPAMYDSDLNALIKFIDGHALCNKKIGAVGFCIGGHLSFRAALNPRIAASACFYPTDLHTASLGEGDDTMANVEKMVGEVLLVWGQNDPHVPLEGRRKIYDQLLATKRLFTWHEFIAGHAFMRDEGARYDASNARLAIDLALNLFQRKLS